MKYADVVADVQERAQIPSVLQADLATRATLHALGRRLAGCRNKQVAYRLPAPLASELPEAGEPASFGVTGFYELVADLEKVPVPTAESHARTVIAVLRERMEEDEFDAIVEELPDDYADLLGGAGHS